MSVKGLFANVPASFAPVASGILQRKCACGQRSAGGDCEDCKKKHDVLQRHPAGKSEVAQVPAIVNEVLASSGQPLEGSTRAAFEPQFGHNFSHVRVHTDDRSAASARAVGADAYTVANHVVFGAGLFRPQAPEGAQLLAHELTHVVQQSSGAAGSSRGPAIIDPDPGLEAEARA